MARKFHMPDLEKLTSKAQQLREVNKAVECLKSVDLFSIDSGMISEDIAALWLFAKYGVETVAHLCQYWNGLPNSLTPLQSCRYISNKLQLAENEVQQLTSFIKSSCPSVKLAVQNDTTIPVVLAPPISTCFQCDNQLVSYHTCKVRYYTELGASFVDKVTLRCIRCKLIYNVTQYGNKSELGFRFYPVTRDVVEATDTVYATRSLLELQCALANHSWVSFQGFAEAYNVAHDLPRDIEMTPEIASELFYNGELELELKTIGLSDYRFHSNSDREQCFEKVESIRRNSIYSHPSNECFSECKGRGCGKLWVTDGIWKVNFPHCMYRVETVVEGVSLTLPDVCTESPVRGKAFCRDHCCTLEQEATDVPTGLLEFIQFCKKDTCKNEVEAVETTLQRLPQSCVSLEQSTAASQGIYPLIKKTPQIAAKDALISDEEMCRKDTGGRPILRKWSRGHQFVVRGGGHIDTWQPLYKSESPSQVLLILIQWLLSLVKEYGGPSKLPAIVLAYDNMCNLDKLKVAKKPLPLDPPYNMLWLNIEKIIDVFHFPNHVGTVCKTKYNPEKFKEKYPAFNTQAGEQTFAWVSRYKRILCAMPKNHHLFYLHRMVRRRNSYTSRCYYHGRKPILPKKR